MFDSLVKRYGREVAVALMLVIDNTYNRNDDSYEFADNLRIAKASVPEEVKAYEEAYDNGCCGFYDTVVMVENADERSEAYLLGFNYGH